MNIPKWLHIMLQYLILFPSAASCYLPMKSQMKYSAGKTAALCCGAMLVPYILAATWVQSAFPRLFPNDLLMPALLIFFALYRKTLNADLPRTLAVYMGVCAVQTFPNHLANAFDVYFSPLTWPTGLLSVPAIGLQLVLACLMVASAWVVRYPIRWMVDHLDSAWVWYSTVALSGTFLVLNVASIPDSPEMYYAGQPFHLFPTLEVCLLVLLVCVYVLFYQGARLMLDRAQLEQRAQLLEMQSHQYQALQEHMRQTAMLRHDFRHSVRLLAALSEQGDLEGIRTYLAEYDRRLAENVAVSYCSNAALNALFGYYHEMASAAGVETDWRLELPEPLTVSELDLASLFGNLMENAIKGCQTLPEGKRYFHLTSEIQHAGSLYIVSTNSFDGRVIKGKDGYYSTKRNGRGTGLRSITAVVEKYGGIVRFSNSETEFFVDAVIHI